MTDNKIITDREEMPIPDNVEGNLYNITLGRITKNGDSYFQGGHIITASEEFCDDIQQIGVCHSINDGVFVIDENGCSGFEDLDDSRDYLEELLKKTCKEDELEDVMMIAHIQEDADYWFRESEKHEWITSLGEMGEVRWDGSEDEVLKKFSGALVITVTPYYEKNIDLTVTPYGAPIDEEGFGFDIAADYHEFCGVRVIR